MASYDASPHAVDETLGAKATRKSQAVAQSWLKDTWDVVEKRCLDVAGRGMFHCKIRFEDDVAKDPENQANLLKILAAQHMEGEIQTFEKGDDDPEVVVELTVRWGTRFL